MNNPSINPLGIELLTVLGMNPVDHVSLAADLGCSGVSMGLTQLPFNPHAYPAWSLAGDPALRREMKAAMRDRGVAINIGEGMIVRPGSDAASRAAELDIFAELGALRINSVAMGCELPDIYDQLAIMADMAAERGMGFCIEFCPVFPVDSLKACLKLVDHIGRDKAQVLIDAMHHFRSGGNVEEVAALDPAQIAHVQLCDAPLAPADDYLKEATFGRMVPGTGELPLRAFVDALPRDVTLGLEVPLMAVAETGRPARDYVGEIVASTRALLG